MYVSIDVGGTKTRIGLSKNLKTFTEIEKFSTPKTLQKLRKTIMTLISSTPQITAISLGVAGQIDRKRNIILNATNIPYIKTLSPKDILPNVKCPIYLENDASLAALAEATIGAGQNYNVVCYITLSTGVGGALVIDKKLLKTRYNLEPGHHIIEIGGLKNTKNKIEGSWEMYSSGTAFRKLYGKDPKKTTNTKVWQRYANDLAIGLHNVTLLWAPDVIILGGGVSQDIKKFLPQTRIILKKSLPCQQIMAGIVKAKLGDENGIIGGLVRLKNV